MRKLIIALFILLMISGCQTTTEPDSAPDGKENDSEQTLTIDEVIAELHQGTRQVTNAEEGTVSFLNATYQLPVSVGQSAQRQLYFYDNAAVMEMEYLDETGNPIAYLLCGDISVIQPERFYRSAWIDTEVTYTDHYVDGGSEETYLCEKSDDELIHLLRKDNTAYLGADKNREDTWLFLSEQGISEEEFTQMFENRLPADVSDNLSAQYSITYLGYEDSIFSFDFSGARKALGLRVYPKDNEILVIPQATDMVSFFGYYQKESDGWYSIYGSDGPFSGGDGIDLKENAELTDTEYRLWGYFRLDEEQNMWLYQEDKTPFYNEEIRNRLIPYSYERENSRFTDAESVLINDFYYYFGESKQNNLLAEAKELAGKKAELVNPPYIALGKTEDTEDSVIMIYTFTTGQKDASKVVSFAFQRGSDEAFEKTDTNVLSANDITFDALKEMFKDYKLRLWAEGDGYSKIGTVRVLVSGLRVRSKPTTDAPIIGAVKEGRVYSVYDTVEKGGYTWYYLGNGYGYVASKEGEWTLYRAN